MNSRWIDIKAQDGGRFKGYLSLPHQVEKGGAGNDSYIPASAVEAVKQTFAGREGVRIDVYPAVDHGFNCWDRPAYNQQSSARARGRSLSFLATTIS